MKPQSEEKIFTGQSIETIVSGQEYIKCAKCNHEQELIGLRSSAWWDRNIVFGTSQGAYLHYKCLTPGQLPRTSVT